MLLSFMTQQIVRIRRATINDHGNITQDPDLGNADRLTLDGWTLQPGGTQEDTINRAGSAIDLTAIGPAGADVAADDLIEAPGYPDPFEIIGEPQRWPSPTGSLDSTVLLLRKWAG